jgi:hypothetical protein
MFMKEFVSRFSSRDESSFLFEVLRRIATLDPCALTGTEPSVWSEWPAAGDPGGPGIGAVRA